MEEYISIIHKAAVRIVEHEHGTVYYGEMAEALMWHGGELGKQLREMKVKAAGKGNEAADLLTALN